MPLQYLNKVLSQYHSANVTTLEDAKNVAIVGVSTNDSKGAKEARKREYSKEQLDSLFDNLYLLVQTPLYDGWRIILFLNSLSICTDAQHITRLEHI